VHQIWALFTTVVALPGCVLHFRYVAPLRNDSDSGRKLRLNFALLSPVKLREDIREISELIFTALHEMQTRSSDENSVRPSVCPSVCLSHACIVTKR